MNRSIPVPRIATTTMPVTTAIQNGMPTRSLKVKTMYAASVYVNAYAKWKRPVTPRMSAKPTPRIPYTVPRKMPLRVNYATRFGVEHPEDQR